MHIWAWPAREDGLVAQVPWRKGSLTQWAAFLAPHHSSLVLVMRLLRQPSTSSLGHEHVDHPLILLCGHNLFCVARTPNA